MYRVTTSVLDQHGWTMDVDTVLDRVRQDAMEDGWVWADWSYLPYPLALSVLGDRRLATMTLEDQVSFAGCLSALAAWRAGRIAVRFDPELAEAVMATPLSTDLPVELLQRIPAWGVYLELPWLGGDWGVFVFLSPASARAPGGGSAGQESAPDELWMVFAQGKEITIAALWLTGGSLPQAVASMEAGGFTTPALRASLSTGFGRPYEEVLAGVVGLLLYLCTADADMTRISVPTIGAAHQGSDVRVVSAGYRIGAALRAHRTAGGPIATAAAGTGASPAAHLRRAHWHSYWVGPRSEPDQRHLEVRWLSPVLVNAERLDGTVTVRSVDGP